MNQIQLGWLKNSVAKNKCFSFCSLESYSTIIRSGGGITNRQVSWFYNSLGDIFPGCGTYDVIMWKRLVYLCMFNIFFGNQNIKRYNEQIWFLNNVYVFRCFFISAYFLYNPRITHGGGVENQLFLHSCTTFAKHLFSL